MPTLIDLDTARTRRTRKGSAPLVYPSATMWNGQIAELYKRNSDPKQIDNDRAQFQEEKLSAYLLDLGYAVRVNDEQGTSGGRLTARRVMQGILERLIAGESHRLAVTELSRLSRDERQLDPAYIAWVMTEHCDGRLLTLGREWNLYESSDRRQYDIDTMMAGWRRQDDKEKALQGMQQYIERVIRGERPSPCRRAYASATHAFRRGSLTDTDAPSEQWSATTAWLLPCTPFEPPATLSARSPPCAEN
jgi:resolvase-like protein